VRNASRWLLGCVLVLTVVGQSGTSGVGVEDPPAAPAASLGALEGTVTYRADSTRPWRYSRYYIKRPKTGELAEAVVALRMKNRGDANLPSPAKTIVIDQENFQFIPETVAIRRGDSVKFTNSDQATHNVQASTDIASFNATMPGGGNYVAQFDRAGGIRQPVQVGCVFHSAMRAWVFVFDHPFYQVTQGDGRFRLEGIPPGEYELEMVHPASGLGWRKRIAIESGQMLHVDIPVSPDDKM
jgi:plastocyanin